MDFKGLMLGLLLAASLGLLVLGFALQVGERKPIQQAVVAVEPKLEPWQALVAFYNKQDGPSRPAARRIKLTTELAEEALAWRCVEDQTDTFLALLSVESDIQPGLLGDDGHSLGVGQVHRAQQRRLVGRIRRAGLPLGHGLAREVRLSVEAFREALEIADGDLAEALARYNGGRSWAKPRAQAYVAKVLKRRARIFGRPALDGERSDLWRLCHDAGR